MSELERALELIRSSRHEEGLAALKPLTEQPGTRYDALGHRAFHYMKNARFEAALADYYEMQKLQPDDAVVAAFIADIHRQKGMYVEAIRLAMRTLEINPGSRHATDVISASQEALGHSKQVELQLSRHMPVRPINDVIYKLEEQAQGFPTSAFPEIGRFLYTLVRMTRPQTVVEAGTYVGYSALHIAQALEDNGCGHLHCFDIFAPLPGYISPVLGEVEDGLAAASGHLREAGLLQRVTLHSGNSSANIRRIFETHSGDIDFAFIDGDHGMLGAHRDFATVDHYLRPGSFVLLHDTCPEKCGWLGPRMLVERLKHGLQQTYGVVNLPTAEGFGLALLQKHGTGLTNNDTRPSLQDLLNEQKWMEDNSPHATQANLAGFLRLLRSWITG